MSQRYAYEKFMKAVYGLATSPKSLQERIRDAWVYEIGNIQMERDIPEGLQAEFQQQLDKMQSVNPQGEEGLFAAAALAMSTEEATDMAKWILMMKSQLDD